MRPYWSGHPRGQDPRPPRSHDSGGFFISGAIVNSVLCLVDGFNLYHSIRDCERGGDQRLRWLDLRGLCESLLHTLPWPAHVIDGDVVYFSAFAYHIESSRPGSVSRHQTYISALSASGVDVVLGHFKQRLVTCPDCGHRIVRFEEKETDVAIASRMLAPATLERHQAVMLVTGDTDLVPAIVTARSHPRRPYVVVAFPFGRVNRQLRQVSDASVRLKRAHYRRHQFPPRIESPDGRAILRPPEWR